MFLFLSFNSYAEELIKVESASGNVILRKAVAVSSIVAKIEITSISPVLDESLTGKPVCGFMYGAKIIQSLKGSSDSFNFFMPSQVSLFAQGKNYLAFIKYRTIAEANQVFLILNDVMSKVDSYSARCRFRSGFYVSANYPLVIPFDIDAGKQFGGQWLVPTSGIIFCGDKPGVTIENDRFSRKKKSGKVVLNWTEVVRLVNKSNRWFDFFGKNNIDSCTE